MIWESLLWVALALGALPFISSIESSARARWPSLWPAALPIILWIAGLGPAYLALTRGAVLARSFGLYGSRGVFGWVLSAVLCASLVGAVWALRRRLVAHVTEDEVAGVIQDEARWALYRAAGVLWFGPWGLLVGMALGGLEWGLRSQPWGATGRSDRRTWQLLLRLAISSLLFGLTGNFWLTWCTQTAGWAALSVSAQGQAEPQ